MKFIRKPRMYAVAGAICAVTLTAAFVAVLVFEKDYSVEAMVTILTTFSVAMVMSILLILTSLWYVGFDDNNKVHFRNMFGVKKEFFMEELTVKGREFRNGGRRFYIYKGEKRLASLSLFDPGFYLLNRFFKNEKDDD